VSEEQVRVAAVVAMDEQGVIGRAGALPWKLSTDLRRFRKLTMGKPLIMGRRTFQSIGKPLDGRDNIIITSDPEFDHPGADAVTSPGGALDLARRFAHVRSVDEVIVIGGAQIYEALLPQITRLYLTRVHASVDGDVWFPGWSPSSWREIRREQTEAGRRDEYATTFSCLERIG
jgi:dihydrofolate reductase